MVITMIVPAGPSAFPAEQRGKHRLHEGDICEATGFYVGKTQAQFAAKFVIRNLGGDLEPRTRRAR